MSTLFDENGLKLTELGETPPIRAADPIIVPAESPDKTAKKIEPMFDTSAAELESTSFADKVLFALTGPADSDLPADKLAARNSRRSQAGNMAASWQNPGKSHMGPVSGGSGSALESLGKLVRLFSGAGG